jgi:hypothetical protein
VRLSDLREYVAEASERLKGKLVFRAKGGAVLYSAPVSEMREEVREPLPGEVLRAVRVGGEYVWGYELVTGERPFAAFRVVADPSAESLEHVRARLHPGSSALAPLFEIAWLQQAGLHGPALEEALSLRATLDAPLVYEMAWTSIETLRIGRSRLADGIRSRYTELQARPGR